MSNLTSSSLKKFEGGLAKNDIQYAKHIEPEVRTMASKHYYKRETTKYKHTVKKYVVLFVLYMFFVFLNKTHIHGKDVSCLFK